ncbi:two-component sensor histidine kinase [Candidatus Moduliflexus flocculans]|uniref:histidine kinase n=1 Tax=Candidatus Moduliflexus flocculans TaxID=1499966 RepID=A0A081BPZ8_9BACT|nr:two-component sensor histidine kinase [Candidatus Moduliflexus flocculans]
MKERLCIIHLEDNPFDAELIEARLESEGIACEIRRVETESDFLSAISIAGVDLILSDYALPTFNGLAALTWARAHYPDVPFIFVTGAMGEEKAVESMKQGATDYVLKQNLARLGTVVRRALREAEEHLKHKQAEDELRFHSQILEHLTEGVQLTSTRNEQIVYVNPTFERLFGYEAKELIGQHVSILNAPAEKGTDDITREIVTSLTAHGEWRGTVHNIRKDGTMFWSYANISTFTHPQYGDVWISVQEDITERKQAEEQIKAALAEKEALLREIYHRTKNNMQVIRSMLVLRAAMRQNPEITAFVQEIEQKILTMALVHQKLYESHDLSQIQLQEYLEDLISSLMQNYAEVSRKIAFKLQVDRIMVLIDTAIPCGLIITELLSNALQYAFPEGRSGEIQLKVSRMPQGMIELYFADNGVGVPTGFDVRAQKSLGLRTVVGLVEHQLMGEISNDLRDGVAYTIRFRDNLHALRV